MLKKYWFYVVHNNFMVYLFRNNIHILRSRNKQTDSSQSVLVRRISEQTYLNLKYKIIFLFYHFSFIL